MIEAGKKLLLFLKYWFLTLTSAIVFISIADSDLWFIFFFFWLISFATECMMNTFKSNLLLFSIYKLVAAGGVLFAVLVIKDPYLICLILGIAALMTSLQSERDMKKRDFLSFYGAFIPTAAVVYLSLFTDNIAFALYDGMFLFFGYVALIFAMTKYEKAYIPFILFICIPALLIFAISFGRFSRGGGGFIDFGWDWLIALPLIGLLGISYICVFFWLCYKYKIQHDEKQS